MADDQSVLLVNSPICRVCQKVYQQPKLLSCLHSFCCDCLDRLYTGQISRRQVTCPVCDVDTEVPTGGVSKLTNNAFLNRISQDYIEAIKNTITKKSLPNTGFQSTWNSSGTEKLPPTAGFQRSWSSSTTERSMPNTGFQSMWDSTPTERGKKGAQHLERYKLLSVHKERSRLSDEQKQEASKVTEKLRMELMHLQGEALRTTYSIEKVSDTVSSWKQQNQEMKTQIQQRSAMLQHLIRRHESQLIAQLTNQQFTERFEHDIKTAKCGLKQNLKNIIQAIEFIKQVQEFATDDDLIDMQQFLLGDLAVLNNVSLNYKQYSTNFNNTNIEDIIADDFGHLTAFQTQDVVFDPKQVGDVNKEQEQQDKADEKNIPRRLQFRRKMNKERRLTSVVDKNWKKEVPKQPKEEPLSNLMESLIQRRRNLLQGYSSYEQTEVGTSYAYQKVQQREMKKKKRRYHSFGGQSALSVAPPDADTLRQINENIQITSEQTSEDTSSGDLSPDKHSYSQVEKTDAFSDEKLSRNANQSTYSVEEKIDAFSEEKLPSDNENESSATDAGDDDQEWTVVTEEVVVPQPATEDNTEKSPSWQSISRSSYTTHSTNWSTTHDRDQKPTETQQTSGSSEEHNLDSSDSEWIVTVEDIPVPQSLTSETSSTSYKSYSSNLSTNKSYSSNMSTNKSYSSNMSTNKSDVFQQNSKIQSLNDYGQISASSNTVQTATAVTGDQERSAWQSRHDRTETSTSSVQEERSIHKTNQQETSHYRPESQTSSVMSDDVFSDLGEWQVTTEEITVVNDAATRSSITQESREARFKFLHSSWQKRKEVLIQSEGFVSPTSEEGKKFPSPTASAGNADVEKTSKTTKAEKSVHFKSKLGMNIRSLLNEEKHKSETELKDIAVNGSRPLLYPRPDRHKDVFLDSNSSASRLTKDRLHEYRQNMRLKTERWRISSN